MNSKTLHEDWKTLHPGPFTEPENEVGYQEFLKIKEQGDIHHHHYAKGDNPDDKNNIIMLLATNYQRYNHL